MPATAISRRQLLRGDVTGREAAIRPPWSIPEPRFSEVCDCSGRCVSACPEGILALGRGRLPFVDFGHGECTFCGECLRACPTGALTSDGPGAAPWRIEARISDACLARSGVVCRTCADQCDEDAIRFLPRLRSAAIPVIDDETCSGCGACYAPCPVGAVSLRERASRSTRKESPA